MYSFEPILVCKTLHLYKELFDMRRSKTDPIGAIIQQFIEANRLGEGLGETRLLNSWEEVVGKTVARYTGEMYIKDKILFVKISSPVVKKELSLLKEMLVRRLNEQAGSSFIHSIRLL